MTMSLSRTGRSNPPPRDARPISGAMETITMTELGEK
jgi:hypothetical protein